LGKVFFEPFIDKKGRKIETHETPRNSPREDTMPLNVKSRNSSYKIKHFAAIRKCIIILTSNFDSSVDGEIVEY
jgi:hypothetical protein